MLVAAKKFTNSDINKEIKGRILGARVFKSKKRRADEKLQADDLMVLYIMVDNTPYETPILNMSSEDQIASNIMPIFVQNNLFKTYTETDLKLEQAILKDLASLVKNNATITFKLEETAGEGQLDTETGELVIPKYLNVRFS